MIKMEFPILVFVVSKMPRSPSVIYRMGQKWNH